MLSEHTSFSSWIITRFAKKGRKWLSGLPQLIHDLQEQWELSEIKPLNNSYYNFTAFCVDRSCQPAFLKIGYPCSETRNEAAALKAFAGSMIDIIAYDHNSHALLMPRLDPAQPLHSLNNEELQNRIAAKLIKNLYPGYENDFPFPKLSEWFQVIRKFRKISSPIPQQHLCNALDIFQELEEDKKENRLLHGDLHHYNILNHGNCWKITDPKGVIGNPLYETACFMYNPSPQFLKYHELNNIIEARIAVFSEILDYHPQQIAMMAYCQSVLSACWCLEDKQDCWRNALHGANLFYLFL